MKNLLPNKFFSLTVLAAASGSPNTSPTLKGVCPGGVNTDFGCLSINDPSLFTAKLYEIGLGFIGGVALLFIVWGGYLILTSQGDIEKLQKGKSYIVSSVIGVVLAISGFAFYQIIAADVLKIPGFK